MLICQCNAMHRRDVVCGGVAAMFSAIISTLLGSSKPVTAEAISASVPELDGVAVRVVVDSYQFAVAPSRKLADVDIQHFGWGIGGNKPPGKTLVSEFGLSMHAETRRGTETRNVLMDFGFTPEALINNTKRCTPMIQGCGTASMSRPTAGDRQINHAPIRNGMNMPYWIVGMRSGPPL